MRHVAGRKGTDIGQHGLALGVAGRRLPIALVSQKAELQTQLDGQCIGHGERGLDQGQSAHGALGVDVGFAKLRLGHAHSAALVGMPEHLPPMASARVEGAPEVKDISNRRLFSLQDVVVFHFFNSWIFLSFHHLLIAQSIKVIIPRDKSLCTWPRGGGAYNNRGRRGR